jgi:hypothetical protein
MLFTPIHCRPFGTLLAAGILLLSACASQPERTAPLAAAAEAPKHAGVLTDFSGHWEKNYQLSDDFNTRFQLYVADIQRSYSRNTESNGFNGGGGVDANAINGLARFAEELTRMPLLDITQDTKGVDIERENDFNLRCFYEDKLYVQSTNAFGSDLCGWNDKRLMFQMRLGGGLQISHQLSLSPDGAGLNIMTTVSSDLVAVPVVISNYYTRYTPPEENYDCQLTLTRNRVCSQQGGRE